MIDILKSKRKRLVKAKKRSKGSLTISADRPRMVVYRSKKYLYVQIVDDANGKVLCSVSSISKDLKANKLGKNIESAKVIGKAVGDKLKEMKIDQVCFDRNGLLYHGKIKALADACRETGIKF